MEVGNVLAHEGVQRFGFFSLIHSHYFVIKNSLFLTGKTILPPPFSIFESVFLVKNRLISRKQQDKDVNFVDAREVFLFISQVRFRRSMTHFVAIETESEEDAGEL